MDTDQLDITAINLEENGNIPNNPELPLLLYRQVFAGGGADLETKFRQAFMNHGWVGTWVNGVYSYHHYHSNAHEVLGVASGSATIIFGGLGGKELKVEAGDMAILPAGTGHCCQSASSDFRIVGAYPQGQQNHDLCKQEDTDEEKKQRIRQVEMPEQDPVAGEKGPLLEHWG